MTLSTKPFLVNYHIYDCKKIEKLREKNFQQKTFNGN